MDVTTNKQLKVSLFLGIQETSTIRMHLNQSSLWKQDSILRGTETPSETHYQGKTYFGFPLVSEGISLAELHRIQKKLETTLIQYCPELPHEEIKTIIFPQILIT